MEIDVRPLPDGEGSELRQIAVRSGAHTFTRLLRGPSNQPDDFLIAPPSQFGFWLVDNWWRLRWEGVPPGGITDDWRLAHDLSAIGGGFVWPRLSMWSDGERIGLASRSDPQGVVGPVRYIDDALLFVPADQWETAVDRFLAFAVDPGSRLGDREALVVQFQALMDERADAQLSDWRRMEAKLGFDVDGASDDLMTALTEIVARFGQDGVEEAVQAAPGDEAVRVLEKELEAARASRLVCELSGSVRAAGKIHWDRRDPPWVPAEAAAQRVRQAAGTPRGPIRNRRLAEILGVSANALTTTDNTPAGALPYSLRMADEKRSGDIVSLRSRYSHDRRFELARALADAIWSESAPLGPITRTKTDRQRFQRAFAQSLLCPFEDLQEFIGADECNDELIMAAAHHFHVNSRVIQTTLVKKHVLQAEQFEDMVEAA